jgi:tRNA A-37 threonylcarbamoyl transferase component Bud32
MGTEKPSLEHNSAVTPGSAPTIDNQRPEGGPTPGPASADQPGSYPISALPSALDALCDEFEAAYKAGDTPCLEQFLERAGDQPAELLFRSLLSLECEYRESRGESLAIEQCIERFPDRESLVRDVFGRRIQSARADLTPTVLGDYDILEQLGGGGMGVVYKARHRRLHRIVALKTILTAHTRRPEALQRFVREVEAIGRLNHPNLVQCTDAREESGIHFLVMEYLEGADLAAIVKRGGPLGVREACEVIRQAAVGLEHIHEQGLVHRDIKPSNLMLTPQGIVKILDLGLARLRDETAGGESLTRSGQTMGTPDYIAPEQAIDAGRVDIRADLYSLGCTLYYLLLGQPPFGPPKHATPAAKFIAHAQAEFPHVIAERGDVPLEVAAILARLVSKRPEDRFGRPVEVAEVLVPWCAGAELARLLPADAVRPQQPSALPARQRGLRRVSRLMAMLARRRVLIALGLLLAAVAIVAVAWNLGSGGKNREILVERANLLVRPNGDDNRIRSLDLLDRRDQEYLAANPLGPTDDFGFRASFNRPAYWYLAWLDTQGKAEIAARSEKAEKTVRFPEGNQMVKVDPQDPAGSHLLLLLVAEHPSRNIEAAIQQRLSALGLRKQSGSRPLQVSVARTRGMGPLSPTTVDLDSEYIARIEQQLPATVVWVYQLYLPTQK